MRVRLTHDFRFEAAHSLPRAPEGHKCRALHGHSFAIEIQVEGVVDPDAGWLLDYEEIRERFEPLRQELDHRVLNEVEGLANPTSEHLARWIWERLARELPGLAEVTVRETCVARCAYRGE